jgi:hypothetical protein
MIMGKGLQRVAAQCGGLIVTGKHGTVVYHADGTIHPRNVRLSKQMLHVMGIIASSDNGITCHPSLWSAGNMRTLAALEKHGKIRRNAWSNKWVVFWKPDTKPNQTKP